MQPTKDYPCPIEDNDQQGHDGGGSGSGGSTSGTRGGVGQQQGGEGSSSFPRYNLAPPSVQQLKREAYNSAWAHGHARPPY